MSFLAKILTKSINKIVQATAKFELAVDDLIDKFKDSCPPKSDLMKIVQQKNQIQTALQSILAGFNIVQTTVNVTEGIVTSVSTAVKVIKTIPVPTAVGFVGIPISVITVLADSLDKLGDILKGAKGAIKVVPSAAKTITTSAEAVITRLQALDIVLNKCIEELAEGMTDAEKNDLLNEIGNVAATAGDNSNIGLNIASEDELLAQLQPGSNNPFRYKKPGFPNPDWLLTIEYNEENDLPFPQRRIKATNVNQFDGNIYRGVIVYNIYGKKYSYSSSVKVLVEEAKFVIDSLDNNWWKRNNPEFNWPPQAPEDRETETETNTGEENNNESSVGVSTQSTGSETPPPPPPPPLAFGPNDPEPIEWPQISNPSNPIDSTIQGTIVVSEPSQSVTFIVDTGQNTGPAQNNTSNFGGTFGSGNSSNFGGTFGSPGNNNFIYQQGELGVRFDSNLGKPDNDIINLWANQQKVQRTYTYNAPGSYNYKLKVTYAVDIVPTAGAKVYFEGYE